MILVSYNELVSDLNQYLQMQFKTVLHDNFKQVAPLAELRTLAYATSRIFIGILLMEQCLATRREKDDEILLRWVKQTKLYKKEKYDPSFDKEIGFNTSGQFKSKSNNDPDLRGQIRPRF